MSGIAVDVADVGKRYRLLRDRRTTIKERIVRGRASRVEEFWALRHVSLQIPRGSVYGLIGHNGSGKSTLLKLIGRIHRPTEGRIDVDGRVAALIELGAGFHPDMTGRENIRLNGSILGLSRRDVEAATGEIVEFSGLGDFIDEPVKTYSSGMYVRLGFSVAVHMRPDVLLVDEVLAVGDEDFQRRCFDHLYALRREGRTIVVVSHALGLVEALCDEVTWLDHGSVRDTGPASSVVPAYVSSVNTAVAPGPGADDGAALPARDRPGSGEVTLTSVVLVDGAGTETDAVIQGAPLRIALHLQSSAGVEGVSVAVSFRHESGAVISVPTTRSSGIPLSLETGATRIDYLQEPCCLAPGHYRVDVAVTDGTGTKLFDGWDEALEVAVRPSGRPSAGGLVSLPDEFVVVDAGDGGLVDERRGTESRLGG